MKFEQLLQIYWSRGFLYGGKTQTFDTLIFNFLNSKPGLSRKNTNFFLKRFEIQHLFLKKNNKKTFLILKLDKRKIINMYLSQLTSINNDINELIRYNLIRLYLIKTFRGRAQSLGKPSRGQRTWSNAWNSYKCNTIIKNFIQEVKKFNFIKKPRNLLT